MPGENLRTYPVYPPDREPPGYWEELQKKKPEPLVDASTIRSTADWVAAGERAFREIDNFWSRTDDPALIAQARNSRSFDGVFTLPDGTAFGPRWVVTADGVKLSSPACSACHFTFGWMARSRLRVHGGRALPEVPPARLSLAALES